MKHLAPAIALTFCALAAQAAPSARYEVLTLEQALASLEDQGIAIFYSSDLIKRWMRVRREPFADEPRAILQEILQPYGLIAIDGPNGTLLLVRASAAQPPSGGIASPPSVTAHNAIALPAQEITVNASRYELLREKPRAAHSFAATELQILPDLGDDPLRALARLPGTASGDFTSKTNIRGGESDEVLVRFDGLTLYNPFHFKDFQGLFSTIDPAIVGSIDVYTGGFPAAYGERMSGVIDITSISPKRQPYREVSLSFFNASLLTAGNITDGDWLLAGRRGNLDVAFDLRGSSLGQPRYIDAYGRINRQISDSLAISGNVLVFEDALLLFDSDHEEQARADYRDRYVWLRLDYRPSTELSGYFLAARSDLSSNRYGQAELPGVGAGFLRDRRAFSIDSIQGSWSWQGRENLTVQFGGELHRAKGYYDYIEQADFDLLFLTPGITAVEPERTRAVGARPDGHHYGAYATAQIELNRRTTFEAGLRWDKETLTNDAGRFSPRTSIMYALSDRARLRAAWGRFYQAQGVHELQVADGVSTFFRPQQANHLLAQVEYRLPNAIDLRLEIYRKQYESLRPRFENLLNTLVVLPELKPDRIRIAPERSRADGVEISIGRFDSAWPLNWWLSYASSTVKDRFDYTTIPRSWNQAHAIKGGLTWRRARWELSIAGRLHSGWPTTELVLDRTEPLPLVRTGSRNGRRLGQYAAIDIRAARSFDLHRAGDLTLFLEITNVTGRHNHCCVEYQIEDETAELDPVLDVEALDSMPAIPSLGFNWRF